MALAVLGAPTWLRGWFGLPLIVLLPGYGLVAVADPEARLGRLERVVVSAGVSLALTVLIGLLVASTDSGLTVLGWVGPLAAVTLLANVVGLLRLRSGEPAPKAARLDWHKTLAVMVGALWVAGVMAAALSIASESAPRAPNQAQQTVGELQMWISPVADSGGTAAIVGVSNPTSLEGAYHLRVMQGDVVLFDSPMVLAAEETTRVVITTADPAGPVIEGVLSSQSRLSDLRRVTLWPRGSSQR